MIDEDAALKIAVQVLFTSGAKKLTAAEIVAIALRPESLQQWRMMGLEFAADPDHFDLARSIGATLSRHVAGNSATRRMIDGTRRGWTLGPKANTVLSAARADFAPSESSQFIGLAGEYAVISELLASDWNATKLPFDDGVDVVATQRHEIRTLQVKTAHAVQINPERFQFQINREAHEKYANIRHYYVLVLRRRLPYRWLNDFMLLSTSDVESFNERGAFYGGDNGRWMVMVEIRGERYLMRGMDEFDVTDRMNSFKTRFR
jgi:hypothetical protein